VTTATNYTAMLILAGLVGACSSTPVPPPPATQPAAAAVAPAARSAAPAPAAQSKVATVTLPAHLDPKSDIAMARSVYFDFDQSVIKADALPLIERHGKYLQSNVQLMIRIEGNTDERGGAEYNLALGQRRAEAVRSALKVYGVKDAQMEAVSWGKERPKFAGHDEAGWGQNRRADIQYPAK